jgi:hypothetical protein
MKKIRLENVPISEDTVGEVLSQSPDLSQEDREKVAENLRKNGVFKYKQVLINSMRTPLDPRSGLSIEEIEKTLPILDAIKKIEEEGVLELDDKDFEYIEQKLAAVRFNGFDERWVRLKHTIKNATKDLLDESV